MGRFSKLELGQSAPPEAAPAVAPPSEAAREEEGYDALSWLRRGEELFFRGQHEPALRAFGQALRNDSTLHEAWVGQIDSLIALNQTREAEVWTTRALDQFPDDPTLLSLRASLLARQGMLKRAMGTSDYALSRGHTLRAWLARGDILLEAESANAAHCLEKALEEIHDTDWQSLTRLGLIWLRHRRHAQALEVFQRACAAQPANAQLWRHIAECQSRLGFNQRAIEAARRAHELEPNDRKTEAMLARLTKESFLKRLWRRLRRR
jgi:tetratricopeptide (TPR) repeat protein